MAATHLKVRTGQQKAERVSYVVLKDIKKLVSSKEKAICKHNPE